MDEDELTAYIGAFPDVEVVVGSAELGSPESAWGDVFFTVAGQQMPFATIVKSDYPGFDESSKLDRTGVFRVNLAVGRSELRARFGEEPTAPDPAALDVLFPHPVYAAQGWISVLNPDTTDDEVRALAERAHTRAAGRMRHSDPPA